MKHGDKILVCFSGSASSVCLIDLIRDSMNDANKKKMSFTINVLYIDGMFYYYSLTLLKTKRTLNLFDCIIVNVFCFL